MIHGSVIILSIYFRTLGKNVVLGLGDWMPAVSYLNDQIFEFAMV
jgi:hypothetical protein